MNMKGGSSETMSTHAENAAETTTALGLAKMGQPTISGSSCCHGHRRSNRFDHLTKAEVPMSKSTTALLLASILVGSVASVPSLHAQGGMMGMGMMRGGMMMQGGQGGMMGPGGMMQGDHGGMTGPGGMMQGGPAGVMGQGGMTQGSQEGMMNMMKQMSKMMSQMSQLMDQYSNMMSNTRPGDQEKKDMPSESDKK